MLVVLCPWNFPSSYKILVVMELHVATVHFFLTNTIDKTFDIDLFISAVLWTLTFMWISPK